MILHHVSSNNTKSTNRRHTSLNGTVNCSSKLSQNIQFEKRNHSVFLIFQKHNFFSKSKGRFDGVRVPLKSSRLFGDWLILDFWEIKEPAISFFESEISSFPAVTLTCEDKFTKMIHQWLMSNLRVLIW